MSPVTLGAIYLTIWWTVLFVILPLGVKTFADSGLEHPHGADAGAPANPNIKRKFITTTWVSAIVWAVLMVIIRFHLVPLPNLPNT